MNNEYVKKLTGKNPKDFEFAAAHIINNCDVEAFSALVEKSDFLFDFIKENVKKRLSRVITNYNYKNLLSFLKIYSPDYEDFIISTLIKFANEDLTDEMLNRLENGSDNEKAYAAKYFSYINDSLAIELLRKCAFSEFDALALNSAEALSAMNDEQSYNLAVEKLHSDDEFEILSAVRFLVSYKDKRALNEIFKIMKKSSMAEHIAAEIPYLKSFLTLLDTDKVNALLAINHILGGLGEIVALDQIFDFELFEVLDKLINMQALNNSSEISLTLTNAKLRFEQLTENDEYIFDEDKLVKEEIHAIKEFLVSQSSEFWKEQASLIKNELNPSSEFVFFALEVVNELKLEDAFDNLKELLFSDNQTIILKTVEVIKTLNKLGELDKKAVLEKISDENIKAIIESLFS